MPKNKGRGGKNYRRGKNENLSKRQLEMKEEGQDYAHVPHTYPFKGHQNAWKWTLVMSLLW